MTLYALLVRPVFRLVLFLTAVLGYLPFLLLGGIIFFLWVDPDYGVEDKLEEWLEVAVRWMQCLWCWDTRRGKRD